MWGADRKDRIDPKSMKPGATPGLPAKKDILRLEEFTSVERDTGWLPKRLKTNTSANRSIFSSWSKRSNCGPPGTVFCTGLKPLLSKDLLRRLPLTVIRHLWSDILSEAGPLAGCVINGISRAAENAIFPNGKSRSTKKHTSTSTVVHF